MGDLRIFVVCYPNGNLHSSTLNQDIAYSTAYRIDGIIGELTNVHKPMTDKDIPEPLRTFDLSETRARRARPQRKADIDGDESSTALDQPEAA